MKSIFMHINANNRKCEIINSSKELKQFKNKSGIYLIYHTRPYVKRDLLYIGASNNLGERARRFFRKPSHDINTYLRWILKGVSEQKSSRIQIKLILTQDNIKEISHIEQQLIKDLNPRCNFINAGKYHQTSQHLA